METFLFEEELSVKLGTNVDSPNTFSFDCLTQESPFFFFFFFSLPSSGLLGLLVIFKWLDFCWEMGSKGGWASSLV